jgi:hypothetical protein
MFGKTFTQDVNSGNKPFAAEKVKFDKGVKLTKELEYLAWAPMPFDKEGASWEGEWRLGGDKSPLPNAPYMAYVVTRNRVPEADFFKEYAQRSEAVAAPGDMFDMPRSARQVDTERPKYELMEKESGTAAWAWEMEEVSGLDLHLLADDKAVCATFTSAGKGTYKMVKLKVADEETASPPLSPPPRSADPPSLLPDACLAGDGHDGQDEQAVVARV